VTSTRVRARCFLLLHAVYLSIQLSMYVYVYTYIRVHAIHWRSHGVMKNPYKILVRKGKQKKIYVYDLDIDGVTLILILNNQDVQLII